MARTGTDKAGQSARAEANASTCQCKLIGTAKTKVSSQRGHGQAYVVRMSAAGDELQLCCGNKEGK